MIFVRMILAHSSLGNPNNPEEIAGIDKLLSLREFATSREFKMLD
jgi:hypothetical protein